MEVDLKDLMNLYALDAFNDMTEEKIKLVHMVDRACTFWFTTTFGDNKSGNNSFFFNWNGELKRSIIDRVGSQVSDMHYIAIEIKEIKANEYEVIFKKYN